MASTHGLPVEVTDQLRKFRRDNRASWLQPLPEPEGAPEDGEVRDLLVFAARTARQGGTDLTLPRTVEALRVIHLVPEDVGARLFEGL